MMGDLLIGEHGYGMTNAMALLQGTGKIRIDSVVGYGIYVARGTVYFIWRQFSWGFETTWLRRFV